MKKSKTTQIQFKIIRKFGFTIRTMVEESLVGLPVTLTGARLRLATLQFVCHTRLTSCTPIDNEGTNERRGTNEWRGTMGVMASVVCLMAPNRC